VPAHLTTAHTAHTACAHTHTHTQSPCVHGHTSQHTSPQRTQHTLRVHTHTHTHKAHVYTGTRASTPHHSAHTAHTKCPGLATKGHHLKTLQRPLGGTPRISTRNPCTNRCQGTSGCLYNRREVLSVHRKDDIFTSQD
jgi:hypothetical protein